MSRLAVLAPITCGCALVAAGVYVAAADPAAGAGLPCPLYQTTGIYCPACGLTRGVHALFTGDVGAAFGYNVLLPLFLVAVVAGWWSWMRVATGRQPIRVLAAMPLPASMGLAAFVVAFGVVRNLPGFEALAP